jgi:hypothetical protein
MSVLLPICIESKQPASSYNCSPPQCNEEMTNYFGSNILDKFFNFPYKVSPWFFFNQ